MNPKRTGPADLFAERLQRLGPTLGAAGHRVVRYIEQNRASVLAASAAQIAAHTRTSDATVVRTVQALGFAGLADLKAALVTSLSRGSTPEADMRRTLAEFDAEAGQVLAAVLAMHREALGVLESPEFRAELESAVPVLHAATRIVVFGMGPSAALARYAATLLRRGGRLTCCLDATGLMLADQLLDLRPGDAVLALAYGRPYREVLALFAEARRLSLPIVLVTEGQRGGLARSADHVLAIPRGRQQRVAMHGGTMVGVEALILTLAAVSNDDALASLRRLDALRAAVSGQ